METVIVSGAIANKCFNGGATWTRLSWALGLQRLGFRVCFIEQIDPEKCFDESGEPAPFESSANLAYFKQTAEQFGLTNRALICGKGEKVFGLTLTELRDIAAEAALLVNITGNLTIEPLKQLVPRKAYIDLDPGFTQFWHQQGNSGPHLEGHDFYFTVGENIGRDGCAIPTNGINWRAIRQPVVLDEWPDSPVNGNSSFTTIASWRGPYGAVQQNGKSFGLKVHEFRKFLAMPEITRQPFELALDIHPAEQSDRAALESHGWTITDPKRVAGDPGEFRNYVQGSRAEFSVAQGIYVETNSGWFSDRTVRYLASGRPALVQDTGFSRNLPVGEGLIAFRTVDEAVRGAESIARDYDRHARAARAIATEYFDSDNVLGNLIEAIGLTA